VTIPIQKQDIYTDIRKIKWLEGQQRAF